MRGVARGGARNKEIEELLRRIEELEHIRDADAETDFDSEAESEIEHNTEDVDLE